MVFIDELQTSTRANLYKALQHIHDFGDIKDVLGRNHCFQIEIYASDFDNILINSSSEDRELSWAEYPSLKTVIETIQTDFDFFNKTRQDRGLNGKRVKHLYDSFKQSNLKPEHFLIVDRDEFPGMNEKGAFYVRDGMHHLVAYGLAVEMKDDCFPIVGYYCTDKHLNR